MFISLNSNYFLFSKRYFENKYPDGPPNLKKKNNDWFKDSVLFMNQHGKPVGDVNMKPFEEITNCHVKPGDLRKINCTELRHDPEQVFR